MRLEAAVRLTSWRPRRPLIVALCVALGLVACDRSPAPAPSASSPPSAAAPMPDAGRLVTVSVEAQGHGSDASRAVAEAMQLAVLQVNGAHLSAESVQTRLDLALVMGTEVAQLRAQAFSEQVRQRSGGMIQAMRILDLDAPLLPGGRYTARIEAQVARFEPPKDLARLKLVLAPLRFKTAALPMGDQRLQAADAERALRQGIANALVQTGRIAVLDREFPAELQRELDMIAQGQAPGAETAKLGQAASADLLWIAEVERLAYDRHVRRLRTSDRELVSYSGGWALNHRLVNVATRQVMLSGRLAGQAPATGPTTLGSGVDGQRVFDGMRQAMVDGVAAAIVNQLFPITVVSRNGHDVVLSQGGQLLRAGDRYAVVALGDPMTDPQTGQSLGRVERPCCAVTIERVTPQLAYGRLDDVPAQLDGLAVAGLQLREALPAAAVAVQPPEAVRPAPRAATAARPDPAPALSAPAAAPTPANPPTKADDKW